MKRRLIFILLFLTLAAGIGVHMHRRTPDQEATLAYLEAQQAALAGTETVPLDLDPETGRVIGVHADCPETVARIITYCTRASVRTVREIPTLAYPLVYVGDQVYGNNEALYYTAGNTILEFSLNETDRLAFLLELTGIGTPYPAVREAVTEGVIRQLQADRTAGERDVLTYRDGSLESIDIRTPETAEVLFQCIRDCVQILDLTGTNLSPMELPVRVGGRAVGSFEALFTDYAETGQSIGIYFSQADAERFREYVLALP